MWICSAGFTRPVQGPHQGTHTHTHLDLETHFEVQGYCKHSLKVFILGLMIETDVLCVKVN